MNVNVARAGSSGSGIAFSRMASRQYTVTFYPSFSAAMRTASYWAGVKPMFSCFLGIAAPPAHSEDRAKSGQFTQAHRGRGHGRIESSPARNPVPWAGRIVHRVVSRVPLHVPGYHSVEGYPCAHLEPGRQLVRPGAIARSQRWSATTSPVSASSTSLSRTVIADRHPSLTPIRSMVAAKRCRCPTKGGRAVTHLYLCRGSHTTSASSGLPTCNRYIRRAWVL